MSAVALDAERVKHQVRARLLGGSLGSDLERLSGPQRRLRVREEVLSVLREERAILPAEALTEMVNQVSDEVVGLGPVERLLKDPEVSEVMVNGADDVYVERKGPNDILRVHRMRRDHEGLRVRADQQARRADHQPGPPARGDQAAL